MFICVESKPSSTRVDDPLGELSIPHTQVTFEQNVLSMQMSGHVHYIDWTIPAVNRVSVTQLHNEGVEPVNTSYVSKTYHEMGDIFVHISFKLGVCRNSHSNAWHTEATD